MWIMTKRKLDSHDGSIQLLIRLTVLNTPGMSNAERILHVISLAYDGYTLSSYFPMKKP